MMAALGGLVLVTDVNAAFETSVEASAGLVQEFFTTKKKGKTVSGILNDCVAQQLFWGAERLSLIKRHGQQRQSQFTCAPTLLPGAAVAQC